MKNFFISYNKADRERAQWIAEQLQAERYSTILQASDFRPGSNFVLEMHRAAQEAERTIAVLSPDYFAASFTMAEFAAVFAQDPTGEKGLLVPVRVRECTVKGLFSAIVYIDLVGLDDAAARRELLDGVKRERITKHAQHERQSSPSQVNATESHPVASKPPIWNVPHFPNPNFIGREDELAQLRASLVAGETAALVQAQAIHGLGGVGKTQLAVKYAYRHAPDYDVVWWVRSEDSATLASDYSGLAAKLDLPEKELAEQRAIVEAVKEWLRTNRGWLLVFDNAEDAHSIRDYLPKGSAGHVIITSRNPHWVGVAHPIPVETLPLDKAIEFLTKRTGQQDETTAAQLAEALGCLPLALEQAGAYIDERRLTIRHYLELFEKRQQEMIAQGRPSTEYPDTVATTWSLSFQRVEEENTAAGDLLRLCAFFAPDDIPIKMLEEGAAEMPEALAAIASDEVLLRDALVALRKYSLIVLEDKTFSIHRLVQAVVRHGMDKAAFAGWAEASVAIVDSAFPDESADVRTWAVCVPLLQHASAVLSYAKAAQSASRETSRLLNQVGSYFWARAEYLDAKEMLERSLAIDEAAVGPDHPDVATMLSNLGSVLKYQGDLEGAKALAERALAIDEAALGANHPSVARDLNNLGSVLQDQGDLEGAKALYERALAIDEAALGANHPSVGRDLNNLGSVLQNQGDLEGAKALYERALAISEAVLGPNHPDVATRLNNLGGVLQDQGDLKGAKASFERSLQIFRQSLGDDHPNTKLVEKNLRLLNEQLRNAE